MMLDGSSLSLLLWLQMRVSQGLCWSSQRAFAPYHAIATVAEYHEADTLNVMLGWYLAFVSSLYLSLVLSFSIFFSIISSFFLLPSPSLANLQQSSTTFNDYTLLLHRSLSSSQVSSSISVLWIFVFWMDLDLCFIPRWTSCGDSHSHRAQWYHIYIYQYYNDKGVYL